MTTYNLGHVVGEKGEKGDQGERGPQGPKGDKGDPGEGVTIVTSWSSTLSDSNVASEKLTKNTIDAKINTSDIANNLTTTSAGKVLDARQGKALADLIGDAIDYINL